MTFVAVPPTDTPGTSTGRPRRSPLPIVLAALVALALALGAVAAVLVAIDAGRDEDAVRAAGRAAFGSRRSDDLLESLQDERNMGSVAVLGMEGAVARPVTSFPQATAATDEALARVRARLADEGGATRRAFAPIAEGLGVNLTRLRGQVTGVRERGLRQLDRAQGVYAGYKTQIDRLLAADRSIALAVDDPTLRRGARLLELGNRQEELSASLLRETVLMGVSGDRQATGTEEIRPTAEAVSALEATGAEIDALATGPFAPAARSTAEARDAALGRAKQALQTGTPPILRAVDLGGTSGRAFTTFHDGVARVMDSHVAAGVGAARDRKASATTVAVLLGLAALAATAAAVVLALTRRRPSG